MATEQPLNDRTGPMGPENYRVPVGNVEGRTAPMPVPEKIPTGGPSSDQRPLPHSPDEVV
jgi:hypothetical protein